MWQTSGSYQQGNKEPQTAAASSTEWRSTQTGRTGPGGFKLLWCTKRKEKVVELWRSFSSNLLTLIWFNKDSKVSESRTIVSFDPRKPHIYIWYARPTRCHSWFRTGSKLVLVKKWFGLETHHYAKHLSDESLNVLLVYSEFLWKQFIFTNNSRSVRLVLPADWCLNTSSLVYWCCFKQQWLFESQLLFIDAKRPLWAATQTGVTRGSCLR